ncbi:D-glycero-beta-D-manno-heptose 1-phosphate adenylyltransferase, partial [Mycobacterium sp. NAZ190054]|uniref:D-glycero-beta-D-manno-heptose 1-phosphate adenylyltransferase n=1 Tax=Mycobacterium sp. NAZ190054 TaxID=1747766 RepID=UPI000B2F11D7
RDGIFICHRRFIPKAGRGGLSSQEARSSHHCSQRLASGTIEDRFRSGEHRATDAVALAQRLRAAGGTVVATGGCFDLLHTGHIRLLRTARQFGDALIVLINSDDSVRALKGPDRPVMAAADRARVLSALACVDAVAVFDDPTPERLLADIRPDIWVKGGDYTADALPEAGVVKRHGGDVVIVPTVAGYSSSALIAAARSGLPTER